MKNVNLLFLSVALFFCSASFAQVQIDKTIQLTNSGSNAKVEGVDQVVNNHDAANKIYVDTAIANRAGLDLNITLTSNLTSVITGSSNTSNSSNPLVITATAVAGRLSPLSAGVTGVPSGATYTLTPSSGYPVPTLGMSLVFNITSVTPGSYPVTITVTGGIVTRSITDTLIVVAKRVFVASATYSGSMGGITGADNSCGSLAGAAGLGGTWKAWLSTSTVNAIDRVQDVTYVRIDGAVVANGKAGLSSGTLVNPISIDESGNTQGIGTWTGTSSNGQNSSSNCSNWTSTGSSGTIGRPYQSNSDWTSVCCGGVGCSNSVYHIYCFEQ